MSHMVEWRAVSFLSFSRRSSSNFTATLNGVTATMYGDETWGLTMLRCTKR